MFEKIIGRFAFSIVRTLLLGLVLLSASWVVHIGLANGTIFLSIDENGNGIFTNSGNILAAPSAMLPDPGPGGLTSALTYDMLNPPNLTSGDLIVLESVGGPISDIIRFNASSNGLLFYGSLVFYSDASGGAHALADTGFPSALYTNVLSVVEAGGKVTYTPTAGQPGFVGGVSGSGLPVTYVILSDLLEPPALALLTVVLAGLGFTCRKRAGHER